MFTSYFTEGELDAEKWLIPTFMLFLKVEVSTWFVLEPFESDANFSVRFSTKTTENLF